MRYINKEIEMDVDSFEILKVTDNFEGTCDIVVKFMNATTILVETVTGFSYKDDKWETVDVEEFINEKLGK